MTSRNRYTAKDEPSRTAEKAQARLIKKQEKSYHATKHSMNKDLMILGFANKIKELQDIND